LDTEELYYYRARYYDPALEKFISEDPIGFSSGDFNWYRYVGNSPVNRIDPRGLDGSDTFDQECHDKCVEDVFCDGNGNEWDYRKCYNKCIEDKYDDSINWDEIRRKITEIGKKALTITIEVGGLVLVFIGGVLVAISPA